MDTLKKTILGIAVVLLILALVFIGVALSKAKDESWPPMIASCPDYWIIDGSGNNATCVDIHDLTNWERCPPNGDDRHYRKNFNTSTYTGSNGECNKYRWAQNCSVSWDGITYGVIDSPCE
jgi:hypothetical protein